MPPEIEQGKRSLLRPMPSDYCVLPRREKPRLVVVVDTEEGPYVIAGDTAPKYGNLEGDPRERSPYIMSGIYTDMKAMWSSFKLIDEIVKGDYSRVIPGHDPRVFRKERYP